MFLGIKAAYGSVSRNRAEIFLREAVEENYLFSVRLGALDADVLASAGKLFEKSLESFLVESGERSHVDMDRFKGERGPFVEPLHDLYHGSLLDFA